MFNIRVECESPPIRHISVQCPKCKKWFYGRDITECTLSHYYQIRFAEFICPICNKKFGGISNIDEPNIEEVSYPKVYEGCLQKREIWE